MSMLGEIAAGGQTWAHRMRMLKQVVKIIVLSSLLCSSVVFLTQSIKKVPSVCYQAIWYNTKAALYQAIHEPVDVDPGFWRKISAKPYRENLRPEEVLHAVRGPVEVAIKELKKSSVIAIFSFCLFSILFIAYFLFRGKQSKEKVRLSGIGELRDTQLAARLKLSGKASSMHIGKIPLLKQKVSDHMLICGVTGSGKTNCLKQTLNQIRKRGERAVVVDTTGSFVSHFYRKGKDILINPYDSRSVQWNPWCECSKDYHYEQLVNSLIPSMQYFDNFFPEAGRAVLYSALRKAAFLGETDIREFVSSLLRKSIGELYEDLRDTDAAVYVDPKGDKTTVSVRATISNSIRHFRPLKSSNNPFSIRDWVLSKEQSDQWLFISCTTEQRKSINNLMSVWFSIAMNAIKARNPEEKLDPIWFVIDEVHSLQKLEYLEESLVEIRKYGGSLVLATQNLSQLDQLYGHHSTKAMIDQCGTKVCFRQGDADIARRMSKFFGEEEFSEVQEGLSYGAHEMRDGVSLSKIKKTKPTVSPSKILELNNLEAYVKLSGRIPAAKTKMNYTPSKKIAASFEG